MLSDDSLNNQLKFNLEKTDLSIGKKFEGKVRDNYLLGDKRLIITTDRISAFDRVLCTIPFKGQILNQTSAFWFDKTKDIVKNHIIEVPDPNVMVVKECKLLPVEMVVRGYLTGVTTTSAWYSYEKGIRNFCGNNLPDGMVKNQKFEKPIITPSTKAEHGQHDESISSEEVIKRNLRDYCLGQRLEFNRERFDGQELNFETKEIWEETNNAFKKRYDDEIKGKPMLILIYDSKKAELIDSGNFMYRIQPDALTAVVLLPFADSNESMDEIDGMYQSHISGLQIEKGPGPLQQLKLWVPIRRN